MDDLRDNNSQELTFLSHNEIVSKPSPTADR